MRVRFTVYVGQRGSEQTGRTFGNFEALTDAEKLAKRINLRLASGYFARVMPFYQGVTSGAAAAAQLPSYFLEGDKL